MQTKNNVKRIVGGGLAAATLAGVGVAATAPVASANVWDRLAECESGGNWSINTGNGYYGGLQFSQQSWNAAGGSGSPANASKAEQIRVAQNLHSMQGWGAWPSCSNQLGLHGESPSAGATSQGSNTGSAQESQQEQAPAEETAPQQEETQQAPAQEQAPAQQETQEQAPAEQQAPAQQEAPAQDAAPQQEQAPAQETQQEAAPQVEASGETYTIQLGDTLKEIADAHGVSLEQLLEVNPEIQDANLIFAGEQLQLPAL